MEKIHENMCFDVVFLYENIRTCFPVFSPFSAHFYSRPPLHHNGKGSIHSCSLGPGTVLAYEGKADSVEAHHEALRVLSSIPLWSMPLKRRVRGKGTLAVCVCVCA